MLKRLRWGGRRLGELLCKSIGPEADYAESWEICDHGADQSVVVNGPWQGWNLQRLVREQAADLLGRHCGLSQFPLLLKFLDAHDRLSVQVHPSDEQARRLVPEDRGKTEAWVILAAEPGSCLYAGLRAGINEPELRNALATGTVEQCLHRVHVEAGDCLFIPAGTVHAIGEGILVAEVQQSSDVTFRLFDWNRLGADGKPRSLHVDASLACIDFNRGPVDKVTPGIISAVDGDDRGVEELVRCAYFVIRRHTLSQPTTIPADDRCHITMGLGGKVECLGGGGSQWLGLGETVLIPAAALPARLAPRSPSIVLEVFWE
jgi:mannose-6-phosphate isomerase